MTFLPLARNSRSAAASSCSAGSVAPSSLSSSSAMAGMRRSLAAARIESVRSHSSVSVCPSPRTWPRARCSGSPESCSTRVPSGAMRRAARAGMRGTPASSATITRPKISSKSSRCRALRSPSRPRHNPEKNARAVIRAACSDLLFDSRRLAGQVAQVVELGAAHAAAALHLNLADRGAVGLEHALDALAVGDLAHRERGVEPAVASGDHYTLVGLHALAIAFDDLHLHHHGVAGLEVRYVTGHALLVQFLNYLAHVGSPRSALPPAPASRSSSNTSRASSSSRASAITSGRRCQVRATAWVSRQRRIR